MKLFTILLLLTALVACKQSAQTPKDFDYGKVENNIYRNKYFNLELPVPPSWVVQNKEQMQQIGEEGKKMFAEKNKEFADHISTNDITSAALLTVFKNKTDSITGEFNPSFSLIAENLHGSDMVKTGADYLEQVKSLMIKSGMQYTFPGNTHTEKLGNHDFELMEAAVTLQGVDVKQYYYATIENGFAFCTILSFGNDTQQQELKDIMDGLRFR